MTHRDIKIALKTIYWMIIFAIAAWFVWSYLDVMLHQNCGGTQHAMNVFRLMLKL